MAHISPPRVHRMKDGWVVANFEWVDEFEDEVPFTVFTPAFRTKHAAELILKLLLRVNDPSIFCMPTRKAFNAAKLYMSKSGVEFYCADRDMVIIGNELPNTMKEALLQYCSNMEIHS